ncbi:hypothetical protein JCM10207_003863 [Rhodosporidiobolus poonsookiae]
MPCSPQLSCHTHAEVDYSKGFESIPGWMEAKAWTKARKAKNKSKKPKKSNRPRAPASQPVDLGENWLDVVFGPDKGGNDSSGSGSGGAGLSELQQRMLAKMRERADKRKEQEKEGK